MPGKRSAFVLGNQAYQFANKPTTTAHDAERMRQALERPGFLVFACKDLGWADFSAHFSQFEQALARILAM